jgi:hypothetical protein
VEAFSSTATVGVSMLKLGHMVDDKIRSISPYSLVHNNLFGGKLNLRTTFWNGSLGAGEAWSIKHSKRNLD